MVARVRLRSLLPLFSLPLLYPPTRRLRTLQHRRALCQIKLGLRGFVRVIFVHYRAWAAGKRTEGSGLEFCIFAISLTPWHIPLARGSRQKGLLQDPAPALWLRRGSQRMALGVALVLRQAPQLTIPFPGSAWERNPQVRQSHDHTAGPGRAWV